MNRVHHRCLFSWICDKREGSFDNSEWLDDREASPHVLEAILSKKSGEIEKMLDDPEKHGLSRDELLLLIDRLYIDSYADRKCSRRGWGEARFRCPLSDRCDEAVKRHRETYEAIKGVRVDLPVRYHGSYVKFRERFHETPDDFVDPKIVKLVQSIKDENERMNIANAYWCHELTLAEAESTPGSRYFNKKAASQ